MGPNLDSLRVVEAKRRTCTGCGKRRMTKQLIPISLRAALCSECLTIRDEMIAGTRPTPSRPKGPDLA